MTGCPITEGYGLSETSPLATCNPADTKEYTGTTACRRHPPKSPFSTMPATRCRWASAGEIAIRGPQVMAGYWNRPDETAKVMTADGFFKSGDVGIMDERGYTKIVDRKKDMILVSGFNVFPTEIEEVVSAHPGVLECACVGVPDAHSGEAVKVFIVRKDPALTAEQVIEYCKEELTAYKKPKYIEFRTELPKSTSARFCAAKRDQKKAA